MYNRPWDDVAVKVRTPIALAPRTAEMALCSDSILRYSESSSPLSTYSDNFSTTMVWGLMG